MSSRDDDDDAHPSVASNLLRAIDGIKDSRSLGVSVSLFPSALIDVGLSIESIGPISLPIMPETVQLLVDLGQRNYQAQPGSKLHHTIPYPVTSGSLTSDAYRSPPLGILS
jgi:hypothetical protein